MDNINLKQTKNRLSEKWQLLNRTFEEFAKTVGLTSMSLTVLGIIYDNTENCTQKLICEQSHFTKQSVNMIIKSFWEQGYVNLVEVRTDRRNKMVTLSKSGMQYADKIVGYLWRIENEVLEKLTDKQREAIILYAVSYEEGMQKAIAEVTEELLQYDKGGKCID